MFIKGQFSVGSNYDIVLHLCHVIEWDFVPIPVIKLYFIEIIVQCYGPKNYHEQKENRQKSNLKKHIELIYCISIRLDKLTVILMVAHSLELDRLT